MIERSRTNTYSAPCFCPWRNLVVVTGLLASTLTVHAWVVPPVVTSRRQRLMIRAVPGADIEQPPVDGEREAAISSPSGPTVRDNTPPRGKVNEIDFCIAPADVSLSRAYGSALSAAADAKTAGPTLSLTRALNNASNRAVRRILLARSWPSAEALNQSLRQVAMAEKEREKQQQQKAVNAFFANPTPVAPGESESSKTAKCPVPRPILNVLTRSGRAKKKQDGTGLDLNSKEQDKSKDDKAPPRPRARTDEEYVADQLAAFRERYGTLPGYSSAEDYLQAVLELATAGTESERVERIFRDGVYDESYQRVVGVLNSVGVTFVMDPARNTRKIASKLIDQDICLSALDKIRLRQEENKVNTLDEDEVVIVEDAANSDGVKLTRDDLGGVLLSAKEPSMTRQLNVLSNIVLRALLFGGDEELLVLAETLDADRHAFIERWYPEASSESITNGDVESEVEYDMLTETRPGVQFLNALVAMLRTCYDRGVLTDLNPLVPLSPSYANAYERLLASSLELGSGYVKPMISVVPSSAVTTAAPSSDRNVIRTLPKPRNAQEELGRFAVWETSFRKANKKQDVFAYPDDLVGTWDVRDVIGGETIGRSAVVFLEGGQVKVDPPLEGLRWRLDPGPTHLDTCTFQVLNSDGTILQYRGFIDRGARLEARFSKRPIKIRGSVMFQMRDGSIDYYKDMLPINYRTGTTKFVMTKQSRD